MTTLITLSTAAICVPVMVWADKGGHGWRRKYRHLPIVIGYTLFTVLTGFNVLNASLAVLVLMQVLSHAIGGAGEAIEVASAVQPPQVRVPLRAGPRGSRRQLRFRRRG
ncbi:hypothetical protein ACWDKQ_20290 [Saccharopolyspora sp. NPDC000995]